MGSPMKLSTIKACSLLSLFLATFFFDSGVFALGGTAKYVTEKEEGLPWYQLTQQQRTDLAPLKPQWKEMSHLSKEKWLALSKRMINMRPGDRERIQSRMSQWASLSPLERGQARLQFDQARQIAPDARIERWKVYNQLSDEDRKQLAARAIPIESTKPVNSINSRKTFIGDHLQLSGKINITPSGPAMSPQRVSASVIQAQPGASTRLIRLRPSPPPHQPAGQLKIFPAVKPQFSTEVKDQ